MRTGTRSAIGAFSCVMEVSLPFWKRLTPDVVLSQTPPRRSSVIASTIPRGSPSRGPKKRNFPDSYTAAPAVSSPSQTRPWLSVKIDWQALLARSPSFSNRDTALPSQVITPLSAVHNHNVSCASVVRPMMRLVRATSGTATSSNLLPTSLLIFCAPATHSAPCRSLCRAIVDAMLYDECDAPAKRLSAWPVATHTLPSPPTTAVRTPSLVRPSNAPTLEKDRSERRSNPPLIPTQMLPSRSSNSDRGEPARRCSYS